MYNRNTVTMTVTDYSGPVTIEASCAAGGVFTSTTSFTKNVTSGQSFTLDPLVFTPTATGSRSYTIDVTTSTGIKIGSKTVTNNITAGEHGKIPPKNGSRCPLKVGEQKS